MESAAPAVAPTWVVDTDPTLSLGISSGNFALLRPTAAILRASGLDVTVFLASSGVDWVRKGAAEMARLNPLDPPMKDMIANVLSNGRILVCPPCAKVRGYSEDDLVDGVTLAGAPAMLEIVKQGASTLSF